MVEHGIVHGRSVGLLFSTKPRLIQFIHPKCKTQQFCHADMRITFDHLTSLEKVMTKAVDGNKFTAGFVHKPVHVSLSPWRLICHEECGHSLFLVSDSNLGKVRPHTFLNTSTFVMAHAPVFDQSRLV